MHDQDLAIVKALVSVAWADGVFAEREREMLDALLEAYGAAPMERKAVYDYAETRRTLDDIDPQDLSADDRRTLLRHAVVLTFADGDQSQEELDLLTALSSKLRIPEPEARDLLDESAERAKKALHLLG
ncbi:MAG TPA: TerB family tellurite resistance protein [Polyangiaceae bacterium]|jgi:tellurite resistance protein|nr:TerB family tellurite resistance protein [Polyangiaceae bacterium]